MTRRDDSKEVRRKKYKHDKVVEGFCRNYKVGGGEQ